LKRASSLKSRSDTELYKAIKSLSGASSGARLYIALQNAVDLRRHAVMGYGSLAVSSGKPDSLEASGGPGIEARVERQPRITKNQVV
jgi:hypothetical protein